MIEICCAGLACVDEFYETDSYPVENIKLEQYTEAPRSGGGPAANAACLLAAWNVGTAFAGRFGTNDYGKYIDSDFRRRGVVTDTRLVSSDYISAHSVIIVNRKNASRTILTVKDPRTSDAWLEGKSAGSFSGLEDYRFPASWQPRIVLADGHEPELAVLALKTWPDAVSVLDAGSLRHGTKLLAPQADYVVASERFALQWTGLEALQTEEDFRLAVEKMKAGLRGRLVITLGERGLIWEEDSEVRHMPAFKVQAADSTGAGDIFHGAFCYGLLQDMSLEETLRLASLTAAISVERPGSRASIPDLDTVRQRSDSLPRPSGNS